MNWDNYFALERNALRYISPNINEECTNATVNGIFYGYFVYTINGRLLGTMRLTYKSDERGKSEIVKLERFNNDGQYHCDWDFPYSKYEIHSAAVVEKINDEYTFRWIHNGKPRENGHTHCTCTERGFIIEWRDIHDKLHNQNAPAQIETFGDLIRTSWYNHGLRHNQNAPAVQTFRLIIPTERSRVIDLINDVNTLEPHNCEWWLNGNLHREDGEARPGEYWRHGIRYPTETYKSIRLAAIKDVIAPLPIPIREAIYSEFYILPPSRRYGLY